MRCIQAACRDLGVPVPSDGRRAYVIGLGLHRRAAARRCPTCRASATRSSAARYRHHYIARQHEIVLFDGTLEMLQALKARNHWLARGHRQEPPRPGRGAATAQLHGAFFDGTRTADETASKPDPLMLLELMGELGVRARAHADDRRHHARPAMARNAGVAASRSATARIRARLLIARATARLRREQRRLAAMADERTPDLRLGGSWPRRPGVRFDVRVRRAGAGLRAALRRRGAPT